MSHALAVLYHLEAIPPPATTGRLEWLAGWVFCTGSARCCAVRARYGRQTVLALHGLPRPDVAAAHPGEQEAALSGFSIGLAELGNHPVFLEWQDESGNWTEFWREPADSAASRRGRAGRPFLPDSLLPGLLGATTGSGRDRSWREAWQHAGRLVREGTARVTPLSPATDWWVFLDEPAGESCDGPFVPFSGWVFGRGILVKRLMARAEPGGLVHVIYPRPRPDVAAVHAGVAAPVDCGFSGMIKLPAAAVPCFTFRLYAEMADGSTQLVISRRFFRQAARDAARPGWKAAGLWAALALAGRYRPQTWTAWGQGLRPRRRHVAAPVRSVVPDIPPAPMATPVASAERPAHLPLVSILVPVYNTPPRYLAEMIASVRAQHYPHWELCLADDASTAPHVRAMLEESARADPRIRPVFRPENGHIARATNTALAAARGEFVALLDHDDLLAPGALQGVADAILAQPTAQFLYTDRDKVDDQGRHFDVEQRGAWNPAMGLTHNYVHHLTVLRRTLVERVQGFRADYFGSQDLDLYLRCHELVEPGDIVHVPVIGYHWRAHAGSTASRGDQKDYMFDSARRGIADALRRRGLRAEPFLPAFAPLYGLNLHQLRWDPALLRENPVSIVVAAGEGADWSHTLAAIVRTVPAEAVEIIVVAAGLAGAPQPPAGKIRAEFIAAPAGTGPAELFNRGAARARHPLLLLLQAGAAPTAPGWLEDLAGWLSVPGVAAVGPKLLGADGRLASAAWTVDPATGRPRALWAGEAPDDLGHQFFLHAARDALLLDPACMLTRSALFRATGGYAAGDFPAAYFAADYCLRLHDGRHRVVFTPQAVVELASAAGGPAADAGDEVAAFRKRHGSRTDPWIRPKLPQPHGANPGSPRGQGYDWMPDGTVEFAGGWFFLEHPQPGVTLASGRQVIHGWCIGRKNEPVTELRVKIGREHRLLTYGHPRPDLGALLGAQEEFCPVGFDLELDLPAGRTRLEFEAWSEEAGWRWIDDAEVVVGEARSPEASGLPAALTPAQLADGVELLVESPAKESLALRARTLAGLLSWRDAVRNPALPFHGYWDHPGGIVPLVYGGIPIEGWLFHETLAIRRVVASFGLEGWMDLSHRNDSSAISARFARYPAAAQCAVVGFVYGPCAGGPPRSLRIWAQLEDGMWHLVYVRRCWIRAAGETGAARSHGVGLRELVAATLAFRWALHRGGVPAPGLAALGTVIRQVRRRFIPPDFAGAPSRPPVRPSPVAQPPHLLLVTHNLNREGAPYFLLELARWVRRETGASGTVVSPVDGPLREEFERQGMTVRLVDRKPLWAARTAGETSRALAALAHELRAADASLIVANTIESFWAVNAARQAGRPSLFYIHESGVLGFHYLAQLGEAARAQAATAIREATLVSFPSVATQAYYEAFVRAGNQRVQPGWAGFGRPGPADHARSGTALRGQLGLAPGEFLVINVGTLCPRKGQIFFVNAIEQLWRTQPALAARCRFLLVGAHDNDYGSMLKAHAARLRRDNLTFVPATARIGDYFAAADLFVLSSFEEGFPRVLLEAMGFALPIVSTAVHAIPEIARDGREALLVAPGDARGLAGAMQRLLEDQPLARKLGQQARQRMEASYTAERVLPRHLRTILELAPDLAKTASRIPRAGLPGPARAAS